MISGKIFRRPDQNKIKSIMTDELLNKFCTELKSIGGDCTVVSSRADVVEALSKIINEKNVQSIVLSNNPQLKEYIDIESLKEKTTANLEFITNETTKAQLKEKISQARMGISIAENMIAETGSVVILSDTEPRMLSLLPEISVIIGHAQTILPKLTEVLEKYYREGKFSDVNCISIISGPSRTADIEKILVTGVHGPKNLHVMVVV
jgi:L-lactate dehydrogenase complex protein LldG